jgi:choline dehydrogenase-like flavoprotein
MNQNTNTYDAIVVGTGISGGWAAKELTEKGLKTLVLERGRMVEHPNYPTAMKDPWQVPYAGRPTQEDIKQQGVQHRTPYIINQASKHWFVNDLDHPYTEIKRFDWQRGYHVGGRSIMWGRHSYRWSDLDFEGNKKDGVAVDWPVRYKEISQWYDYVEAYAGITGQHEGLSQLPDGKFLKPFELNCVEQHLRESVKSKYGRTLTPGRVAHATEKLEHSSQRGTCQSRNLCIRGCPYGGYFSSLSSTLPAATKTGNMTLRPNSIVYELIYDDKLGKATGVRLLDGETGEHHEFKAKIIFLCASTFGSTFIMMNSVSSRFPNGFGNDSGELGCNIMDHQLGVGASAQVEGFEDKYYYGRKPGGFYLPRYQNLGTKESKRDYLRGFGYQGGASRQGYGQIAAELQVLGAELKEAVTKPGIWGVNLGGFGEILPYHDNKVVLNKEKKDKFGLPTLTFDAGFKENEAKMRKDMEADAAQMLEDAGYKNVTTYNRETGIGLGIHEMGTARMGRDPKTSVLNGFNQVHACKNVFVTDGSFMASAACVNPSLTYMAFTARAADFAASELKKGNL